MKAPGSWPHISSCASFGNNRAEPVVHHVETAHPGRRCADLSDREAGLEQGREAHFVSAVGRRQQSLMQASLAKPLDDFVRHTAVGFTSRRPLGKMGNQGMSARDEIVVGRGFGGTSRNGRNPHGSTPTERAKPAASACSQRPLPAELLLNKQLKQYGFKSNRHRRCEERSDEAIQDCEAAWIASLRSQ